jgi:hypothetical protein
VKKHLEILLIAPGDYGQFDGPVPIVVDYRARKAYPFPNADDARAAVRDRRGYRGGGELRKLWAAPGLFELLEAGKVLCVPEPMHDLRKLNSGDAWL